jgi:ankyrin repeat protein
MREYHPDPPVYAAVTQEDGDRVEAVRVLLAAGEDPNAPDSRGYTPLRTFEAWGDPALTAALLEGGAAPSGPIISDMVRNFF